MAKQVTKKQAKFSARIRFNWGFHDATQDAAEGRPNRAIVVSEESAERLGARPLPSGKEGEAYRYGYFAGQASFSRLKTREASSDPAWNELGADCRKMLESRDEEAVA